jgi:hypothetical protein
MDVAGFIEIAHGAPRTTVFNYSGQTFFPTQTTRSTPTYSPSTTMDAVV